MTTLTKTQEDYLLNAIKARMGTLLNGDGNLTLKRVEYANGLNYYEVVNSRGIDVLRVEDEIVSRLVRDGAILHLKNLWERQNEPRSSLSSINDFVLGSIHRLTLMQEIAKEYNVNIDLYLEW